MRKIILLLTALTLSVSSFAQSDNDFETKYGKGKMPYNENGEVVFSRVINADSVSKNDIYKAIKVTITDMFNSAKDVIQMDDQESCIMVAKGFEKVPTLGLAGSKQDAEVWFTVRLQARDSRFRIDIYQIKGHTPMSVINGIAIGPFDWPAETLTYEKTFKPNGKMRIPREGFFRRAIIDGCNGLLDYIETNVKNNLSGDTFSVNEDW